MQMHENTKCHFYVSNQYRIPINNISNIVKVYMFTCGIQYGKIYV